MKPSDWFDDVPVIGSLSPERAAEKLREMGEEDLASSLMTSARGHGEATPQTFGLAEWLEGETPAWQHTAHTFGHIPPLSGEKQILDIKHAGQVAAEEALRNARLMITLDGLRAADYPGSGEHRILFDFYGQNQTKTGIEDLHFNSTYRVREGEKAAILGYPVFVGLQAGANGVVFKCFSVNVKNTEDERFLSMIESDVFKSGLKLASTAQPAIAPLTGMAIALTKSIATRNRNVPVQDFYLGLDFSAVPTRARLATGSYIAVQIPEALRIAWRWEDWLYDASSGNVVARSNRNRLIPYNYVIIGVSRYLE